MSEPIACRSCDAPVIFAKTATGALCPYDTVDGKITTTSHFITCPDRNTWTRRKGQRP